MLWRPLADQKIKRPGREQRLLGWAVSILSAKVPDVDPAFCFASIDDPETKLSAPHRIAQAREIRRVAAGFATPSSRARGRQPALLWPHAAACCTAGTPARKVTIALALWRGLLRGRIGERVAVERERLQLGRGHRWPRAGLRTRCCRARAFAGWARRPMASGRAVRWLPSSERP